MKINCNFYSFKRKIRNSQVYIIIFAKATQRTFFRVDAHIAQNIAEKCQEYFQYFIAIEILL